MRLFYSFKLIVYLGLSYGLLLSSSVPEVKIKKELIDKECKRLIKGNGGNLLVYVKIQKKNGLLKVINKNFPENVETSYNVFRDKSNRIISVLESPYSESGDWDVEYVHYFDSDGKTIAFERRTGFFNSECTNDAAHEVICHYYNPAFTEISKVYKLTDSKGKTLNKSKCTFNYEFTDYKIYKNSHECLMGYKIKI